MPFTARGQFDAVKEKYAVAKNFQDLEPATSTPAALAQYDRRLREWCSHTGVVFVPRPSLDNDVPIVHEGVLSNVCHYSCAVSMLVVVLGLAFWMKAKEALRTHADDALRSTPSWKLLDEMIARSIAVNDAAHMFSSMPVGTSSVQIGKAYSLTTARLQSVLLEACRQHQESLKDHVCEDKDSLLGALLHGTLADGVQSTRAIAILLRASLRDLSNRGVAGLPECPSGILAFAACKDDIPHDEIHSVEGSRNVPNVPSASVLAAQHGGLVPVANSNVTSFTAEDILLSLSRATPAGKQPTAAMYYHKDHFFVMSSLRTESGFNMMVDNDQVLSAVVASGWALPFCVPVLAGFECDGASDPAPRVLMPSGTADGVAGAASLAPRARKCTSSA